MKKASGKRRRAQRSNGFGELQDGFVKGLVSTGLLATLRDRGDRRRIVHSALQGGTALAAASFAAAAVKRRSLAGTLSGLALGVAGLYLIDQLTNAATEPNDGE